MKFVICLWAMMAILLPSHAQDTLSQRIDELIGRYAAYNKFNGTVLVAVKGKVLLEKGYGWKDVGLKTGNDVHTIFRVGSITKEFTAAVVLRLAAAHRLELTDPVSKYFAGFPSGDKITIENLLGQTSGIFNYTDIGDFWNRSGRPTTERAVLDSIMGKPALFTPGEKFGYSNSNYMLLAYIIQKVTGQSYEAVVRKELFEGVGMEHSGFDFRHLSSEDKATGYWTFSPAGYMKGPEEDSSEFIGSGGLYTTVGDLYKWHEALQKGRVLDAEWLRKAYAYGKGPYGYGWELDTLFGKKIVGHGGRVFGFEAKMIRVPAEDIFIILLNNTADEPCLDVAGKGIMAILCHQAYGLPEAPIVLPEAQLKIYAGRFSPDGKRFFETMVINGHLFGKESSEHPAMELFPRGGNRFMIVDREGGQIETEFVMDEKGVTREIRINNVRLGRKFAIPRAD